MEGYRSERTPGFKLFLAIAVALVLTIPLFSIYLLSYDRQTQSTEATQSITAGWGGEQTMNGPLLVIPYRSLAERGVRVHEDVRHGPSPAAAARTACRAVHRTPNRS